MSHSSIRRESQCNLLFQSLQLSVDSEHSSDMGTSMAKIKGTKFDDDLAGGVENDLIYGLAGNDTLSGGDGDDRLEGSDGNNVLIGGAGNDVLLGGNGADVYKHSGTLADGDDIIKTSDNGLDKIVFTSPGFDFDFIRDGKDLIVGLIDEANEEFQGTLRIVNHYAGSSIAFVEANLTFNSDYGTDPDLTTIYFTPDLANGLDNTDSTEVLLGTNSGDVINGNGGFFDYLSGAGGKDVIHGGDGFDNVRGGDGNDQLFGDGDNDVVRGDRGDDYLDGGDGSDLARYDGSVVTSGVWVSLSAGLAKDLLGDDENVGTDALVNFENVRGSSFGDLIIGDFDDNFVNAGGGNDTVKGGAGNDGLFGDSGDDSLSGEAGDDSLGGGNDSDTLAGGEGNDFLVGDNGNDALAGGIGDDFLFGDFFGDNGDDTLAGGAGNDFLEGGDGADQFDFDLLELGDDTVNGFDWANDTLSFSNVGDQNGGGVDITDLLAVSTVSDDGFDVTVSLTTGANILFAGVGTGFISDITQLVDSVGQITVVS
jgi:Ca2+-binding RTX toxin-like protein